MRLIDADALKEYIDVGHLRVQSEVCFSECDVIEILDEMPTVDAVPVEWLQTHITTIEQQRLLDEWVERKEE